MRIAEPKVRIHFPPAESRLRTKEAPFRSLRPACPHEQGCGVQSTAGAVAIVRQVGAGGSAAGYSETLVHEIKFDGYRMHAQATGAR
jgi:hypothetical protein